MACTTGTAERTQPSCTISSTGDPPPDRCVPPNSHHHPSKPVMGGQGYLVEARDEPSEEQSAGVTTTGHSTRAQSISRRSTQRFERIRIAHSGWYRRVAESSYSSASFESDR